MLCSLGMFTVLHPRENSIFYLITYFTRLPRPDQQFNCLFSFSDDITFKPHYFELKNFETVFKWRQIDFQHTVDLHNRFSTIMEAGPCDPHMSNDQLVCLEEWKWRIVKPVLVR